VIARGLAATAVLGTAVLSSCALQPQSPFEVPGRSMELLETPFFPQARYQCGPAALATVLADSGAAVDLQDLVARVYLPARRGSLQVEILAAARTAARVPYRIDGSFAAIVAELDAGRPVLVLQNLGVAWLPRWHYAVVVGFDAERRDVILRSGTDARRRTPIGTFLRTWRRSDNWGLVVLEAGELPARPDPQRLAGALADMEAVGRFGVADAGWQSALELWPDDTDVLFGAGNASLRAENYVEAERLYRRLLHIDNEHWGAHNNLAYALHFMGRSDEALAVLADAMATTEDDLGLRTLAASRQDIAAAAPH
jgi:hypothetical protein